MDIILLIQMLLQLFGDSETNRFGILVMHDPVLHIGNADLILFEARRLRILYATGFLQRKEALPCSFELFKNFLGCLRGRFLY